MVSSSAKTVDAYLASLHPERREVSSAMRTLVLKNLPEGYVEGMDYGMISYSVPLSRFPETYNGHALDAGKSCVRFKTLDDLALDAVAESIASMPVDDYIALYERSRLQTKAGAKKATVKKVSSK